MTTIKFETASGTKIELHHVTERECDGDHNVLVACNWLTLAANGKRMGIKAGVEQHPTHGPVIRCGSTLAFEAVIKVPASHLAAVTALMAAHKALADDEMAALRAECARGPRLMSDADLARKVRGFDDGAR